MAWCSRLKADMSNARCKTRMVAGLEDCKGCERGERMQTWENGRSRRSTRRAFKLSPDQQHRRRAAKGRAGKPRLEVEVEHPEPADEGAGIEETQAPAIGHPLAGMKLQRYVPKQSRVVPNRVTLYPSGRLRMSSTLWGVVRDRRHVLLSYERGTGRIVLELLAHERPGESLTVYVPKGETAGRVDAEGFTHRFGIKLEGSRYYVAERLEDKGRRWLVLTPEPEKRKAEVEGANE